MLLSFVFLLLKDFTADKSGAKHSRNRRVNHTLFRCQRSGPKGFSHRNNPFYGSTAEVTTG